jgi:hypothetical protein
MRFGEGVPGGLCGQAPGPRRLSLEGPFSREGGHLQADEAALVDAHLIQKLLHPCRHIECSVGRRGPQLVTEPGEKVLADYDDWAIAELRRNEPVCTGWMLLEASTG